MSSRFSSDLPQPPSAHRDLRRREIHGETLEDAYDWLRERDSPRVISYLEAENAFAASSMKHTEELQQQLFDELVGRLEETDSSAPVQVDGYWYYSRTVRGQQYAIHCRKQGSLDSPEEVLLDLNAQAEKDSFLALGALVPSPDHRRLAYSLNTDGSEDFTLVVIDLASRERLCDPIHKTSPSVAWANDNETIFYVRQDETRRPYQVLRQSVTRRGTVGTVILQEDDERFFVSVFKTRSRRFLGIRIASAVTAEIRVLDADQPTKDFRLLCPRIQGVELDLDHHGDSFYVLTNQEAVNFKLMRVPIVDFRPEVWREVIPHRPEVQLEAVHCFRDHWVIQLRREGLRYLSVRELATGKSHEVSFEEEAYEVSVRGNPDFEARELRFAYSSLVTPMTIVDYDMATRKRQVKKRTVVLGGYERDRFTIERRLAAAPDGTAIPISLVYQKELVRDGSNPMLLGAYGAYGICSEPRFSAYRLSLLERGFVCAIAHVRGGGELGRCWYEDGKLLKKKNTFDDFIAVAEHLIAEGYTSKERLAIRGGSAGGLLIGAVLNLRPDLFAAAVADVPFVDALNSMLDPTVPLTVTEFEEWGDPRDRTYFDYIRSYSPYDNVGRVAYPHLLVIAGLNDPRVQYWEPAKWTAKLRDRKQGCRRLLLKVHMDSGHGGASGRYDAMRQEAFRLAFVLDSLNCS